MAEEINHGPDLTDFIRFLSSCTGQYFTPYDQMYNYLDTTDETTKNKEENQDHPHASSTELDPMTSLFQESKERESKLKVELVECRKSQNEVDDFVQNDRVLELRRLDLHTRRMNLTSGSQLYGFANSSVQTISVTKKHDPGTPVQQ